MVESNRLAIYLLNSLPPHTHVRPTPSFLSHIACSAPCTPLRLHASRPHMAASLGRPPRHEGGRASLARPAMATPRGCRADLARTAMAPLLGRPPLSLMLSRGAAPTADAREEDATADRRARQRAQGREEATAARKARKQGWPRRRPQGQVEGNGGREGSTAGAALPRRQTARPR